jgi:hypothetical protein
VGPGIKNDCAGEGQQQFTGLDWNFPELKKHVFSEELCDKNLIQISNVKKITMNLQRNLKTVPGNLMFYLLTPLDR